MSDETARTTTTDESTPGSHALPTKSVFSGSGARSASTNSSTSSSTDSESDRLTRADARSLTMGLGSTLSVGPGLSSQSQSGDVQNVGFDPTIHLSLGEPVTRADLANAASMLLNAIKNHDREQAEKMRELIGNLNSARFVEAATKGEQWVDTPSGNGAGYYNSI